MTKYSTPPMLRWAPPAEGLTLVQLDLETDAELQLIGGSCANCYPVSRNILTLFAHDRSDGKPFVAIAWDVYLGRLADAAERGCQFCSFMAVRFFHDEMCTFFFDKQVLAPVTGCCGSAPKGVLTNLVRQAVAHLRHHAGKDIHITLLGESFERGNTACRLGKVTFTAACTNLPDGDGRDVLGLRKQIVLELYTKESDPGAPYIPTRPIHIDPNSKKSLNWVKSQIRDCSETHKDCPAPVLQSLPRRIVRIIDDDQIKIEEEEGKGLYTALSYCWGGSQTFTTTTESLKRHLHGFETKELPQTLRDAIVLTRRLGIDHIWIDSLCIIQDCLHDKNAEIPKMADYYRNAYVTICAAAARCSDGFLAVHDECNEHPNKGVARDLLQLPYCVPGEGIGTLHFREECHYCLSDEPISARAWTLQERILSPRSLTYGSRLVWQCNQHQTSEGGSEDWSFDLRSSGHRRLQLDFAHTVQHMTLEGGPTRIKGEDRDLQQAALVEDCWHRIVEEYSLRLHSDPSDKLPAISAVATDVGRLTGDTYVAGLWCGRLLWELMWHTRPELGILRHEPWCAPTWSWASVRNKVSYRDAVPHNARPVAEVVTCGATPTSMNAPFGSVKSATLVVRAPVVHLAGAHVDSVEKKLQQENQMVALSDEDGGLGFRREFLNLLFIPRMAGKPDIRSVWEKPEKVSLLALFAWQEEDPSGKKDLDPVHAQTSTENHADDDMGYRCVSEPLGQNFLGANASLTRIETDSSPEGNRYPSSWKDQGFLAGLIVQKDENGKYKRIGTLKKLWFMNGLSGLPGLTQQVELV